MPNDSTTAGFLLPTLPGPKYDAELEDIFHDLIAGITGLPGNLVRPRWQPDPPNMPDFQTNWCAFGVTVMGADWDVYTRHDPGGSAGDGVEFQSRGEVLQVLCSFYGPNYQSFERLFRDGLHIAQNRDLLTVEKIKVIDLQEPVTLPALLKEKWVKRIDAKLTCHRWVTRTFQVRHLVGASVALTTESGTETVPVNPLTVNP